jgi:hypothetical protein
LSPLQEEFQPLQTAVMELFIQHFTPLSPWRGD